MLKNYISNIKGNLEESWKLLLFRNRIQQGY